MTQLSPETIAGIRSWLDALSSGKPGFKRRKEQDRAINAIALTLESSEEDAVRVIALEGPTGVGKSLAYVIAGLVAARRHDKTLVISTATIALQQQLAADLAAIESLAPYPVRTVVVKGRGRYLCERNLTALTGEDPDQLGLDLGGEAIGGQWPFAASVEERQSVLKLRASRVSKAWDGDLDAWADPLSKRLRPLLTTTSKGCAGKACPHVKSCSMLRVRRSARDADVVVVNHALLLSDQREGGGSILPDLAESILVVDEAHHLPDVAVEAAAASMVVGGQQKRLKGVLEVCRRAGALRAKTYSASALDRGAEAERDLQSTLDDLGRALTPLLDAGPSPVGNGRRYGRVFGQPTQLRLHAHQIEPLRGTLETGATQAKWLLDQVAREKEKLTKDPPVGTTAGMVAKMTRELGDASDWLQSTYDTLVLLGSDDDQADAPTARWVTRDGQGHVEVHASPVDASGWLAGVVWRKAFAAVAVSATLRAMGDFRHFAERSGLRRVREARFVALPSPFDLERSAVLRVPPMVSEPSSEDAFLAEVLMELESSVDAAEATLILCASRALMEALVERAPLSWKGKLKVQGKKAIGPLLEEHRASVAAGSGSILIGLATLAEGVDLPGKQVSHVVVVKLPFMSPSDPVSETRSEWIEKRGHSAFAELLLPDAHRRLVQACGRLIRTETDTGRITILDRRLVTKPYGRKMVDTLPPYRRDIGAVRARGT